MVVKPDEMRVFAAKAERKAREILEPTSARVFLELARQWRKLAEAAERERG
jgi:hypothetical protein